MSEITIQSKIIDELEKSGQFFIRLNNIPPTQFVRGKRVFRKLPKGSKRGLPDIVIIKEGGEAVWVEVKSEIGKQSEHQKKFENNIKNLKGRYYVVRSLEEFKSLNI